MGDLMMVSLVIITAGNTPCLRPVVESREVGFTKTLTTPFSLRREWSLLSIAITRTCRSNKGARVMWG